MLLTGPLLFDSHSFLGWAPPELQCRHPTACFPPTPFSAKPTLSTAARGCSKASTGSCRFSWMSLLHRSTLSQAFRNRAGLVSKVVNEEEAAACRIVSDTLLIPRHPPLQLGKNASPMQSFHGPVRLSLQQAGNSSTLPKGWKRQIASYNTQNVTDLKRPGGMQNPSTPPTHGFSTQPPAQFCRALLRAESGNLKLSFFLSTILSLKHRFRRVL